MDVENSLGEVFRFVQLRPPKPASEVDEIPLVATELARTLADAPDVAARIALANAALADERRTVSNAGDLHHGDSLLGALARTRRREQPTTAALIAAIGDPKKLSARREFTEDVTRLSDTLLAASHGTVGAPVGLATLEELFRVYWLIVEAAAGKESDAPLDGFLQRPLVSPVKPVWDDSMGHGPEGRRDGPRDEMVRHGVATTGVELERVIAGGVGLGGERATPIPPEAVAIEEVARLDHGRNIVQPTNEGLAPGDGRIPFTLTPEARARLSEVTTAVLREHGIDLDVTPVDGAVALLAEVADSSSAIIAEGDGVLAARVPSIAAVPGTDLHKGRPPLIRPAGVAALLVVKQQIKRYEAGEIAHVENVLAGEKRGRTHRRLERTEETFTTEVETTREQETELETAERFELNRETARTIKQDLSIGFGLSVSGKYGPTVEFTSNLEMESSQSVEESTKSATTYSKDVVQRSLERIAERVREERVRRIIRETEETNVHELANDSPAHSSGIYQFLDKVYEAQVFDYGIREMFDFMVPEPASFLWYVDKTPSAGPRLPDPPLPIDDVAPHAGYIDEWNYRLLSAMYGATDIEPPPPLYQTVTGTFEHGEDDADEEGQPRSRGKIDLAVPEGYKAWRATIDGLALTDENPVIGVTIGNRSLIWEPGQADRVDLGDDYALAFRPRLHADFTTQAFDPTAESKLTVTIVAFETNTYTLNATLVCRRTGDRLGQWRLATYGKIRAAYEERVQEHKQTVSELQAQAEAQAAAAQAATRFGLPPSQNRETVRQELKKHCISILTRQRYDAIDATQDGAPPLFDFDEAADEGSFIRFFEQAFEWDQMQHVLYPYYWARKGTWVERFAKQDTDPEYREFWRAGAARVVVPVRPGFEVALTHFLETGKLWNGLGDPPDISSELYVSIIEEIKERTGAGKGELPVGEPWDVRVPTPLVLVRPTTDLPRWRRLDPSGWEWRPVEPGDEEPDGDD